MTKKLPEWAKVGAPVVILTGSPRRAYEARISSVTRSSLLVCDGRRYKVGCVESDFAYEFQSEVSHPSSIGPGNRATRPDLAAEFERADDLISNREKRVRRERELDRERVRRRAIRERLVSALTLSESVTLEISAEDRAELLEALSQPL